MIITIIALILNIIGGINWLLIGIFGFDLVNWICQGFNVWSRIIYTLVGVSALWLIGHAVKLISECGKKNCENGCSCEKSVN